MTAVDDLGFINLKHNSNSVVSETFGLTQFSRLVQKNTCSTVRNISLILSCKSFEVLSPETTAVFGFVAYKLKSPENEKKKREGNLGQKLPYPSF